MDPIKIQDERDKFEKSLEEKNISADDLSDKLMNWENHTCKRYYKENSYDFTLESIGIWTNREIVEMACDIIISKLAKIKKKIGESQITIESSNTAIKNAFDVTLDDETYTIGKLITVKDIFELNALTAQLMGKEYFHTITDAKDGTINFSDEAKNVFAEDSSISLSFCWANLSFVVINCLCIASILIA